MCRVHGLWRGQGAVVGDGQPGGDRTGWGRETETMLGSREPTRLLSAVWQRREQAGLGPGGAGHLHPKASPCPGALGFGDTW